MKTYDQASAIQKYVDSITVAIDKQLSDPAERMIVKLYLENYPVDEIARFGGVSQEYVDEVVKRSVRLIEEHFGYSINTVRTICTQYTVARLYA